MILIRQKPTVLVYYHFISEGNIVKWWPLSNDTSLFFLHLIAHLLQLILMQMTTTSIILCRTTFFISWLCLLIFSSFFSSETPLFHSAMAGPSNLKCNISFDLLQVCFKIVRSISTSLTLVTVLYVLLLVWDLLIGCYTHFNAQLIMLRHLTGFTTQY